MAFGSNLPEQHPVIYWRLKEALEKRKFPVIVVDPRVTMFAQFADIHLPITPGTDLVLLNSLAHVIFDEGLADEEYIAAHCNGSDELRELVQRYDPTTAAKITGIDEDTIRHVARTYARAGAAMSIWTMGINQSTHGSDGVCAINNLNLITGNIGKPGGTSLSITGQCNAMGTREWSSCSGLPGYRALENAQHREEVGKFWGVDPEFFPKKRGLFMTDIFPPSNPARSGPVAGRHQSPDLHAQHRAHPQGDGETGVLRGAGRFRGRRAGPVRACIFSRQCLGRKRRLLHQHRATREPGDAGHPTAGQLETGFVDIQSDGENAGSRAGPVPRTQRRRCSRK